MMTKSKGGRPKKFKPHLNIKRNRGDVSNAKSSVPKLTSVPKKISNTESRKNPPLPQNIEINTQNEKLNSPEISCKRNACSRELRMLSASSRKRDTVCHAVSPSTTIEKNVSCDDLGNRVIHFQSLIKMIERSTVCSTCYSQLKVTEETVGISTSVGLLCPRCKWEKATENTRTNLSEGKVKKFRTSESYALNCQFVLGLQQIGGGPADASVIITYLGLPHAATFKSTLFSRIESKLRPVIKKISNESMLNAVDEEVRGTRSEEMFKKWEKKELPTISNGLTVCYDMGWNKRSTGTRYDSISGHGIMFGAVSKKVLSYRAVSKVCSFCDKIKSKKGEKAEIPAHECVRNHLGSSKSMESEAILYMCKESFYSKGFYVHCVCADDDTTMKKVLRHNYNQLVKDGVMAKADKPKKSSGKLDFAIPEPSFLADFNHRVKSVGRALYELAKAKLADSTVNKDTAKRLKLYWSQMLNQIKHLSVEEDWEVINKRVRAPVEHIFNNHEYCDIAWCYAKQAAADNQQYIPPKNRPFYSKKQDKKMYEQLLAAVSRFQTKENVAECLHRYNTQKNEALNQMVARFVPKNKHFGTTPALDTRLACCVAITNMGYELFYSTLLDEVLEAFVTKPFVYEGLKKIQRKKLLDSNRQKKIDNIKRRVHGREAKAQREILEERVDAAENMGTYGPSVAMAGQENENENTTIINKPGAGRSGAKKYCPYCKALTNHISNRSKHCLGHNEWKNQQEQKKAAAKNKKKRKETHESDSNNTKVSEDGCIRRRVEVVDVVNVSDRPENNIVASSVIKNDIASMLLNLKSEIMKNEKEAKVSITDNNNVDCTNPNTRCVYVDPVQIAMNNNNVLGQQIEERTCIQVQSNISTGDEFVQSTEQYENSKYMVYIYTLFFFFSNNLYLIFTENSNK